MYFFFNSPVLAAAPDSTSLYGHTSPILPICLTCPVNFITFYIFKHTHKYLSTIHPPYYNYFLSYMPRHSHWLSFTRFLLILNCCCSTHYIPLYPSFTFLFFFTLPVLAAAPDNPALSLPPFSPLFLYAPALLTFFIS